ncbi:FkbM family methyltransferase [Nocardioides sp.]|uniref:FkbM family methyltransferase n=1 Tax=Nocardioides sp. TaxID=35761 RepID=UPI0027242833|nr:FkbM family methyltransferase [Nocardioides sp.]MDO9454949.1 FkbM family methyltransferase [Nocardioides sp.]
MAKSEFVAFCLSNYAYSHAQLKQDLFVLFQLAEKRDGFFVEFGATNGVSLSNSMLLESRYGWSGILAEPARVWHAELSVNRACTVDHRCVSDSTGDFVLFNETVVPEFSTIEVLSAADVHRRRREGGVQYEVETVTLIDLLDSHNAPAEFDYLSVDTEGSEATILESFDFDRFRPKIITVEHNFHTENRSRINVALSGSGYHQVWPEFSLWDDWYVAL